MRNRLLMITWAIALTVSSAPAGWAVSKSAEPFAIVSWNLQTFGDVKPERQKVCKQAYAAVLSTSVYVMAFQEVANNRGINIFQQLIPPKTPGWQVSFEDTPDSQDNGILFRVGKASETSEGFLFDESGTPDTSKATHPFRVGHYRVGDFDFTLVSLHLTFRAGDAAESKRELMNVFDWLQAYQGDSKNDPDVIVAGDFNLGTDIGKTLSVKADKAGWPTINSIIAEHGGFTGTKKLTVLVDEPTSRSKKHPANNYDHFIISEHARKTALIRADRVSVAFVDSADKNASVQVSDHYPVEVWFRSKGRTISPQAR